MRRLQHRGGALPNHKAIARIVGNELGFQQDRVRAQVAEGFEDKQRMLQVIEDAGEYDEIEALVQARNVMGVRQAVVDVDIPDLADLLRLIEEFLLNLGSDDAPCAAQLCLQREIAGIGSDIEHGKSDE